MVLRRWSRWMAAAMPADLPEVRRSHLDDEVPEADRPAVRGVVEREQMSETEEILEAVRLAQTVLGKTSARDASNDGCRPIWTALDWCERWFEAEIRAAEET